MRYSGCISPLCAIRLRLPCTLGGPDSGVNIGDCPGISYWLPPISKSLPNAAIHSWPEARPMARPSLWTITLGSNSNTLRTGPRRISRFWCCRQRRREDFLWLCGNFIPWKRGRLVASSRILSARHCQHRCLTPRRHNRNGTASGMFVQNSSVRHEQILANIQWKAQSMQILSSCTMSIV